MRYHITEDGPKPCRAQVRECPIGGEHFEGLKDARDAYEEKLASEYETLKTHTPDEVSATMSAGYAHWSIVHDHLHNAGDTGNEAEILYYSTPQGRLELARRLNTRYKDKALEKVLEVIDQVPADARFELDENHIARQVEEGEKLIPRDSSFLTDPNSPNRHNEPLRHYLVEQSHRWLKRLSSEQQEAVSWLTSNGFALVQHAIGVKDDTHTYIFENLVDRKPIDKRYPYDWDKADAAYQKEARKISKAYLRTVLSAFEKAPKLDEPIVIGRGTSVQEVHDLVGDFTISHKELFDRIERGDYDGANVSEESRMSKIPLSATVVADVMASFAKREYRSEDEEREIYITVRTRTMPTPVNVGAWSAGEGEVFINPLKKHRIIGGSRKEIMGDEAFLLELEELD